MSKRLKKFIIEYNKSIKDALKVIDKNGQKTCFVIDGNGKLYGSITDGDIRRKILKSGKSINEKVKFYCNKKTVFIVNNTQNTKKIKRIFSKKKIEILPIVNSQKKIINIVLKPDLFNITKKKIKKNKILKKLKVVIMAGGKGQRLNPITKIFPKPLVPIKEKTAIENIIDSFSKFGIKNFFLILNYKGDLIKAFFKSKNNLEQNISYIDEKMPLGTAGGLEKLKNKIKEPFIVSNCDVFFKFNLNKLISCHNKNKYDLTIVVSNEISILPYGVCELDVDSNFKKIKEKPKFKHIVTTGLYVLNPSLLKIIPKNRYQDMNSLIEIAKNKNFKIGIFKIGKNNWKDIGQLRDYKKNISLLSG
jgi:dTDP-glucose pyrophosphorylase